MSEEDIKSKTYYQDWKTVLIPRIRETKAWSDMFDGISSIFAENINKYIHLLRYIRDPFKQDRLTNIQQAQFLGFKYKADVFTDNEYANLVYFLSYYNKKVKGTNDFINFLGWIKNARFELVQLWAKGKYNYSDDPKIKDPFEWESPFIQKNSMVDETGTKEWYPTSHVDLEYNGWQFQIDESDVWYLFYKCAPIHLVLRSIAAVFTMETFRDFFIYSDLNGRLKLQDSYDCLPCIYQNPSALNIAGNHALEDLYDTASRATFRLLTANGINEYPLWSFNKKYTAQTLPSVFTFTRNSPAFNIERSHYYRTEVPDNYPRFAYEPYTSTNRDSGLGLLMEEARTNLLLNSNAPERKIIALPAGTYTFSGSGYYYIYNNTAGTILGRVQDSNLTFTLDVESQIEVYPRILESSSWYQLEVGNFATSYIQTTSQKNATRAADILQVLKLPTLNRSGSFALRFSTEKIADNCVLLKAYESSDKFVEVRKTGKKIIAIIQSAGKVLNILEDVYSGLLNLAIKPTKINFNGLILESDLAEFPEVQYANVGQDFGNRSINGYVEQFYYVPNFVNFPYIEPFIDNFQFTINSGSDSKYNLPISSTAGLGYSYNWTVDWGDGTSTLEVGIGTENSGITHNYPKSYTNYQITIKPNQDEYGWGLPFGYDYGYEGSNSRDNKNKLISLDSPMSAKMVCLDESLKAPSYFGSSMFDSCANLTSIDGFALPNFTEVSYSFCAGMFQSCSTLTSLGTTFTIPDTIIADDTHSTYITDFCEFLFLYCTRLSDLGNFNLPQGIINCGDSFCRRMFYGCSNLHNLNENFNLPQNITSCGNNFCDGMFYNCYSLSYLNDNFNLPQKLTGNVGVYFCNQMFYNCTDLAYLPNGFNFPQNITEAGNNFCTKMFYNCANLTTLPVGCNLPVSLIQVGESGFEEMFKFCTHIETFPRGFTIPRGILYIGDRFCFGMFQECSALRNLPSSFNLPTELISTAGRYFCSSMFQSCSALQYLPSNFTLPEFSYAANAKALKNYCSWMFQDCTSLRRINTTVFTFPQNMTSCGENFAIMMFYNCSTLWYLPNNFNFPQNLEGDVSYNFASQMFQDCTSLRRINTTVFTFPQGITSCENNFAWKMFQSCSALQYLPSNFTLPQGLLRVGDTFCGEMFGNCTNLNLINHTTIFNLPQNLTKVGNSFCAFMFNECSNINYMPNGFNLPQKLVGNVLTSFCFSLFANCSSLISLPNDFNMPQGITSCGSAFCQNMFRYCRSLISLGNVFTFPQSMTSCGNQFCYNMFQFAGPTSSSGSSTQLAFPDNFNLPERLEGNVGDYFCSYMFDRSYPTTLGKVFTFPQGITSCRNSFGESMFYGATTTLTSLPDTFNLPQNLTSVGNSFCVNLLSTGKLSALPQNFNIPQKITSVGDSFLAYCFGEQDITSLPENFNLPQRITGNVGNRFCQYLFYNNKSLTNIGKVFTFPQGITSCGKNFAYYAFSGCPLTSLSENFNLPQGITGNVGNGFVTSILADSKLISLPENFNLPQGITSCGNDFAAYMFIRSSITSLPENFNLPQGITSCGEGMARQLCSACSDLTSIGNKLQIPQNLSSVGGGSFHWVFGSCDKLTSGAKQFFGNIKFNKEQLDSYTSDNIFQTLSYTFYNCSSLDEEISPATIPQLSILPSNNNKCFSGVKSSSIQNCPTNWGGIA